MNVSREFPSPEGLTTVGEHPVTYEIRSTDPLSLRERARVRVKYTYPSQLGEGELQFSLSREGGNLRGEVRSNLDNVNCEKLRCQQPRINN